MNSVDLRPAALGDVEQIVALWKDCGLTRPWNNPHADFGLAMQTNTSTVLVAVCQDKMVGTIMAGFDGHRGWLYYLAVAKAQRRSGLATLLIANATDWLRTLDCPKVELMVREDNLEAAALYETLGWQQQPVSVYGLWLSEEKD